MKKYLPRKKEIAALPHINSRHSVTGALYYPFLNPHVIKTAAIPLNIKVSKSFSLPTIFSGVIMETYFFNVVL